MESPLAFVLVLIYVACSALFGAFVKLSGNRLVLFGAVNGLTMLVVLPLFLFLPLPAPQVWPFIFASSVAYNAMLYFAAKAYQYADLSVVYPLARAVSFLVIVVSAKFLLAEQGHWYEWLAIGIIFMAILMQMSMRQLDKINQAVSYVWMGLMGVSLGLMWVFDIMGVRLADNTWSFIAALMFVGLPATLWALLAHRRQLKTVLVENKKQIVIGALLDNVGYACFLYAIYGARALYAVPLSNLSVVAATLLGLYYLKEHLRLRRLLSAIMIAVAIMGVQIMDIVQP